MPAVKLTWYDGGLHAARCRRSSRTRRSIGDGGVLYVGRKGKMLQDSDGAAAAAADRRSTTRYGAPKETLARVPHQAHEMNWVNAIKGTDQISCPFSYAAHLTEIMLLGVVVAARRSKLHYDGANMRVTNNAAANEFLTREYRQGWNLS